MTDYSPAPPTGEAFADLQYLLAGASESQNHCLRLLLLARARVTFASLTRRMADAERLLLAQEAEMVRVGAGER